MITFSYRKGNLELRSCDPNLRSFPDGIHTTAEIVCWSKEEGATKEYCFVVLRWVKQEGEGEYDFKSIGGRPFSDKVDEAVFWQLVQKGNALLNKADIFDFEGRPSL